MKSLHEMSCKELVIVYFIKESKYLKTTERTFYTVCIVLYCYIAREKCW